MKHFLKIYMWQGLSLLSGFAAMFIVTPFLSLNQSYFGIYTFVISLGLFLSYADFGFLSAGVKFASEAYANKDRTEEVQILGFVFFILFVVFAAFGLLVLFFAFNPQHVLKGLKDSSDRGVAQDMFVIFATSLPILAAQRGIQLIFNLRLFDFLFQRVASVLNLVKIISAFYFFRDGHYQLIEFYIFSQLITLLSVIIGSFIAKKEFDYDFTTLLKAIRYNPSIYKKTKSLAFNSLYVTISWIIYYELDSLIVGRFVGLKEVAIFNICISVMTLARSFFGIIYNPFSAKFNHYIGRQQNTELQEAFKKVLVFGLPLSVIPTAIILLTAKNFIYTWVGIRYAAAVPIVSFMFASYFFTFLSSPTGIAMVAKQQIKSLYLNSTILPIVYWTGIALSFKYYGLLSFGVFKFVAVAVSGLLYFYYCNKMFEINWRAFFKKNVIPACLTVILLIVISHFVNPFLPTTKGKKEFALYAASICAYGILGMTLYWSVAKEFQQTVKQVYVGLTSGKKR